MEPDDIEKEIIELSDLFSGERTEFDKEYERLVVEELERIERMILEKPHGT